MKISNLVKSFLLLSAIFLLNSCQAIADIFKAGMGFGIFIAVVVVAVIVFIIIKITGNNKGS
ncbi:hypothetical protein [Ferruginibacter profundus]